MSDWLLSYEGYDPAQEGLREALCTLGNGYFATRGAAEESRADGLHYPGTYVAGCYNRLATEVAGRTVENEDLVNVPNWLPLTFRLPEGGWFDPGRAELLEYRLELDMRAGVLRRDLRFRDAASRTTRVASRRLVHMLHPHLAAVEYVVTPEDWSGPLRVRTLLDGSVVNAGVPRYRALSSKHLEVLEREVAGPDLLSLLCRTTQSHVHLALAACTRAFRGDEPLSPERLALEEAERVGQELELPAEAGRPLRIEKVAALYTSRDPAVSECGLEAREALGRCSSFAELLASHRGAWRELWSRCDVELDPPGEEQRNLRLHVFHLLQTVSLNTIGLDAGVPARGLHGEAYRGHVFWDELFVFPFYSLRFPMVARSLLLYRYRRLPRARWMARQAGYAGAMYPWQSGSDGREETQVLHLNPRDDTWGPDASHLQRHVNAAVAYNVWQYSVVTGDREFLSHYGAEMLLEIARFFASLARLDEGRGRYVVEGVMGPDEYSEGYPGAAAPGLRNNAYTNVMAVWVLERALEALETLPPARSAEITERIGLPPGEPARWRDIIHRMSVPFHDGVISQYEGYEELQEFPWAEFRRRYGDISRLDRILKAEGDSPDRYKLSKQADVLMLFYLLPPKDLRRIFERLGYPFDDGTMARTVAYYLARTTHGSTLSRVVHASVLDRLDRGAAWELFRQALRSDVADVQGGTTPEGIHLGAMGATVDIVLRHYAGIDTSGDTIAFNPRLPAALQGLRFGVRHHGQWYQVHIAAGRFTLEVEPDGPRPLDVRVLGEAPPLLPGQRLERALPPPD